MIGREHPLFMVNGVFNAVYVHGNMLGDSMYYGKGAGKLPTASAVVSDVVDCARHIGKVIMCFWEEEDVVLTDMEQAKRRFFVRVPADKEKEAIAIFGGVSVIEADVPGEFAFVTDVMSEKEFKEKAGKTGIISRIRIEE
jgi:homoserine dehydrogenase